MAAAPEAYLQASTLFTLMLTAYKRIFIENKIGHKVSGDPLLCLKSIFLRSVLHLNKNNAPPILTPLLCHGTSGEVGKYHPINDLHDPQGIHHILCLRHDTIPSHPPHRRYGAAL